MPLEPLARVPRHLGDARAAIEAACCPAMASVFHFISRFARLVFGDVFFLVTSQATQNRAVLPLFGDIASTGTPLASKNFVPSKWSFPAARRKALAFSSVCVCVLAGV